VVKRKCGTPTHMRCPLPCSGAAPFDFLCPQLLANLVPCAQGEFYKESVVNARLASEQQISADRAKQRPAIMSDYINAGLQRWQKTLTPVNEIPTGKIPASP